MIIPNIWKNTTRFKPPTSWSFLVQLLLAKPWFCWVNLPVWFIKYIHFTESLLVNSQVLNNNYPVLPGPLSHGFVWENVINMSRNKSLRYMECFPKLKKCRVAWFQSATRSRKYFLFDFWKPRTHVASHYWLKGYHDSYHVQSVKVRPLPLKKDKMSLSYSISPVSSRSV